MTSVPHYKYYLVGRLTYRDGASPVIREHPVFHVNVPREVKIGSAHLP